MTLGLVVLALALGGRPARVPVTVTTTILPMGSVLVHEDLEAEVPLEGFNDELDAEVEVEVGPGEGKAAKGAKGAKAAKAAKDKDGKASAKARKAVRASRVASYTIGGQRRGAFAVVMPKSAECVLVAPGATLTVQKFKLAMEEESLATLTPANFLLNDLGVQSFRVGATLKVAAHQARKTYRGHFFVTVAWD